MATSETSHGTARLEARWAGDGDSAADLLRPLAGHKGYGLGLVVDVLAGILSGAGWSGPHPGDDYQGDLSDRDRSGTVLRRLRGVRRRTHRMGEVLAARGRRAVLAPGEPGALARARATGIPVDPTTWAELQAVFAGDRRRRAATALLVRAPALQGAASIIEQVDERTEELRRDVAQIPHRIVEPPAPRPVIIVVAVVHPRQDTWHHHPISRISPRPMKNSPPALSSPTLKPRPRRRI